MHPSLMKRGLTIERKINGSDLVAGKVDLKEWRREVFLFNRKVMVWKNLTSE